MQFLPHRLVVEQTGLLRSVDFLLAKAKILLTIKAG
ncbi:hypothetical protein G159_17340 [Planococcus glaciei CHR43]|nr:hypothetical protein G159_17340 [Planococcus glaciei CHR43]